MIMPHQSGSWKIASASVQGTSHKAVDVECQDVHRVDVTPVGELIIVVADGAGSAKHARWGAEIAVTNVTDILIARLAESAPDSLDSLATIVEQAVRGGHAALISTAESAGLPVRSFHTTLTCVLVSDVGVIVGKIGDGVVVDRSESAGLQTLAPPDNGEYVNSTYFLTQLDGGHAKLFGGEVLPDAIAVTTDGLLEVAFDLPYSECVPWENFFNPLFAWLSSATDDEDADARLAGFLTSEAIRSRCDDDLTLVIATWNTQANEEPDSRDSGEGYGHNPHK